MTFEEKISRIDAIIQLMNKIDTPLEQQMALYEEGYKLINECSEFLEESEKKIIDINQKMENAD
jgi:exodeoxyribonuclease VII small subunit